MACVYNVNSLSKLHSALAGRQIPLQLWKKTLTERLENATDPLDALCVHMWFWLILPSWSEFPPEIQKYQSHENDSELLRLPDTWRYLNIIFLAMKRLTRTVIDHYFHGRGIGQEEHLWWRREKEKVLRGGCPSFNYAIIDTEEVGGAKSNPLILKHDEFQDF